MSEKLVEEHGRVGIDLHPIYGQGGHFGHHDSSQTIGNTEKKKTKILELERSGLVELALGDRPQVRVLNRELNVLIGELVDVNCWLITIRHLHGALEWKGFEEFSS